MEKAELFSDFFSLVFTRNCSSHTTQVTERKGTNWENKELPTVGEDKVQEYLRTPKVHKSLRPDETHPCVLRKLVDEVVKPLPIILRCCGGQVKFPLRGKKGNITPFFNNRKKGSTKEQQINQSHLGAGKIMEQVLLESILRHLENKEVIHDS